LLQVSISTKDLEQDYLVATKRWENQNPMIDTLRQEGSETLHKIAYQSKLVKGPYFSR
jgi:hypothetical protein